MGADLYQVEEDDIEGNEKLFLRYMLMEMANMMKQARLKIKRMNFTDYDFTIINYHFGKMPEWWRIIKKEDMLRTLGVSMMLDDFILKKRRLIQTIYLKSILLVKIDTKRTREFTLVLLFLIFK